MEDPADIFPRDAHHSSEVILGNFLLNDNSAFPDVATKLFGKPQQHAGNAPFQGKKASSCHDIIGEAQTGREQGREVAIELRPGFSKRPEGGAANEAQL